MTPASVLGIEIASASPATVLNSTMYVPSVFGPKIMIRFCRRLNGRGHRPAAQLRYRYRAVAALATRVLPLGRSSYRSSCCASQFTQDPDRVRSFGGYNKPRLAELAGGGSASATAGGRGRRHGSLAAGRKPCYW